MKYKSLRTKILLILAVVSLLLIVSIETNHYYDKRSILYKVSIEKLLVLTKTIRSFEKKQKRLFVSRINQIQNNDTIINAIHTPDINTLLISMNKYTNYYKKANLDLEHIHIYNLDLDFIYSLNTKDLTSVHSKSHKNIVLNQAINTKKTTIGYVMSKDDGFYYSIISPLKYKNSIIAYIEFGIKADNLFKIASKAGRYKYALYLKNNHSNSKKRELGNLVASNSKIFKKLNLTQEYIYKVANTDTIVSHNTKYYLLHQYDIEKDFQKDFAQVIMASNVTSFVQENKKTTLIACFISLFLVIIMLIALYLILTKLINKLIEDEKKLNEKSNQIQAIMDYSENFVTYFEYNKLALISNSFLLFLEFSDMKTFLLKYNNLSQLFSEEKDILSLRKSKNNLQWIRKIYELEENDRIVAINHEKSGLHYFNVKITRVPNHTNSNIVVFSDITSLYKNSKMNEYESNHDELTGIYNRHYFDTTISKVLLNQKSVYLLMLDLDLFKKINDTYGHQMGDEVLIKFTKVISHNIRENDIFARWGGEEFVILIFEVSDKTTENIAEKLRQEIEKTNFYLDAPITCSIGVSKYKENEDYKDLLKRADNALYEAKDTGRNKIVVQYS